MAVVLREDKCPACHCFVREGATACPNCGATWPKIGDEEGPQ